MLRRGVPEQPSGVGGGKIHGGIACTAGIEPLLPAFCRLENWVDVIAVLWLVVYSANTIAGALVHKKPVDKELAPGRDVDGRRWRE